MLLEREIPTRPLVLEDTGRAPAEPLPLWFEWALRAALYALLAFALVGMPLAMASAFRPVPVLVLTLVVTAALLWAVPPEAGRRPSWGWAALAALALAAASALFNVRFASEHVLADRDPGIYLWHGRWIASAGRLFVDSGQSLFGPLIGTLPKHCPASCPGAPGGGLYVQFLHLFPLTLAGAEWLGGPSLMVKTNALLAGVSLACFFAFATRLVRPVLALAATAALAADVVQVHFARDSVSEILAQALLFGGLYLLWEARRRWDPLAGTVAGVSLGATCMVRIDSFLYLIPLAVYLFLELAQSRERRRFVAAVAGGLALTAALGFADLYFFSRGYFHYESEELRGIGIGLAATLVAGSVAVAMPRLRGLARPVGRRLAAAVPLAIVALALFAAFVRPSVEKAPLARSSPKSDQIIAQKQIDQALPVEPRRGYGEHTMVWLDWYLGPVALAAGVAGLALLSRLVLLGRAGPAVPFLGVFLATALLYLWRPSIFPDQIWAMRRFVPVVIPGFLLLAAWAAHRLLDVPRLRRAGPALAVAIVAGCIAVPLAELVPLREERQQAGAVALIRKVCRSLPPRAAVIVVKSPDYNDITQPVHAFCQVPVGQLNHRVPHSQFATFAPQLRRSGHNLALLSTNHGAMQVIFGSRAPKGPLVKLDYKTLEQRLASRPKKQLAEEFRVYFAAPR